MAEREPFDLSKESPRFRFLYHGARLVILVALVAGMLAAVQVIRHVSAKGDQSSCMDSLRSLGGGIDRLEDRENTLSAIRDVRSLLALYGEGRLSVHSAGVFVCPGDPDAVSWKEAEEEYAGADLSDREFVKRHVSYAVRDFTRFPIAEDDPKAWVLCDRNGVDGRTPQHRGTVHVLHADGQVRGWQADDLGFAPDEPIVVGPDSPHPELRKMIFFHPE